MCFMSPNIPEPPPPPADPPPEDRPGEVVIGSKGRPARGQPKKVRGRERLTVGLTVPRRASVATSSYT